MANSKRRRQNDRYDDRQPAVQQMAWSLFVLAVVAAVALQQALAPRSRPSDVADSSDQAAMARSPSSVLVNPR